MPDVLNWSEAKNHTQLIAPHGLGFGEGSVSAQNVPLDIRSKVFQLIDNEDLFISAVEDDDGCPDGRRCIKVINADNELIERQRQKVFGGGSTMVMSARIGTGKAEDSFLQAFDDSFNILSENNVNFGAHSADRAAESHSGCGAIDNAPSILRNTLKYEDEIRNTINMLVHPDQQDALGAVFDTVLENNRHFLGQQEKSGEDYSGRKVLKIVEGIGKAIKELADDHKEVAIVLNIDIEARTLDQAKIREISGDEAQVFSIDIPRKIELTRRVFHDEDERKQALISMLAYSLATSATLTKGDLPVYAVYRDTPHITL
jgi:hypothetical protein